MIAEILARPEECDSFAEKLSWLDGKEEGLAEGREAGLAEGREEGRIEGRREGAAKYKDLGVAPEIISQVTGLSLEEIQSL